MRKMKTKLLRVTLTLTLFLWFSFLFFSWFLSFVYGPTLEWYLYRPEIGPYMVWFYNWTRSLLISLLIRFLDDIFWFGYLVFD